MPASPQKPKVTNIKVTYNVTNKWTSCFACFSTFGILGCRKRTLELGGDRAILRSRDNCSSKESSRTYERLIAEEKTQCCCVPTLRTNLTPGPLSSNSIVPGCGCNARMVRGLLRDIERRGPGPSPLKESNAATLEKLTVLHEKVDMILDHLHIAHLPTDHHSFGGSYSNQTFSNQIRVAG